MCQQYLKGGLRMTDVFLFLSGMKLSWVRRLLDSQSIIRRVIFSMYPDIEKLRTHGTEYANTLMNRIKNPFWHDVLKHMKRLQVKCVPRNIHEFNAECIFYNINILVGNHTIFFRDWVEMGIYQICHILDDNGVPLSFDALKIKYPNLTTNFLNYSGMIKAIKAYQERVQLPFTPRYILQKQMVLKIITEGNRSIQNTLSQTKSLPTPLIKWNTMYNELNWSTIFLKCHKTTLDCQLKWFQLRIIYRILPTNRFLYLRKIVDSATCNLCLEEEQTILHLLWSCTFVCDFWKELQELLINKCVHITNLSISEELVLFGVKKEIYTDGIFDFILLLAKYYIYTCKLNNVIPRVQVFHKYLKKRYVIEKYYYAITDNIQLFENQWHAYKTLLH